LIYGAQTVLHSGKLSLGVIPIRRIVKSMFLEYRFDKGKVLCQAFSEKREIGFVESRFHQSKVLAKLLSRSEEKSKGGVRKELKHRPPNQ